MSDKKTSLADFFAAIAEAKSGREVDVETPKEPIVENNDPMQNYLSALKGEQTFLPEMVVPEELKPKPVKEEDYLNKIDLRSQYVTQEDLNKHYKTFVERVQKQLTTLGGGGEKEFRFLDDVNRSTMTPNTNNWVLEYDANSKAVQFTNRVGPIELIRFDRTHVHDVNHVPGTLCWSEEDETLNLSHPNGVRQQIGQETYAYVRNKTGSTIPNGTAVQFSGAETNGTARLLVAPMLANGTVPTLYGLGITTEDIEDGADGRVTVWGKLRDINTTAFSVGDVLYVSPTVAGGLTNVKPTAPDNVIPMAAVLRVDSAEGEIFVRPSYEQQKNYGNFTSDSDQTVSTINTATPIRLNTALRSQQLDLDSDTTKIRFNESGLYSATLNTQIISTNASAKQLYFWLRLNDSDLTGTTRHITITGTGVARAFTTTNAISIKANDTLTYMWASSDVAVRLDALTGLAFAPDSPSVKIDITQDAL
jgi:hypothetical protein